MADKDSAREQVYSITSAREAHSDELGAREIKYAISMAFRSICFVGGVIAWQHVVWLGVVLMLLAVFLPYTSVVLANAGVRKKSSGDNLMDFEAHGELGPGSSDRTDRSA
ncbi:MAG: DUF3099 domain-containing protein [Aeromicrobium erythreum]